MEQAKELVEAASPASTPPEGMPPAGAANSPVGGVPLRDYFAAAALQGAIARGVGSSPPAQYGGNTMEGFARAAFAQADWMLHVRQA